ncbi:hypothetical protein [Armatimonas sp.]|uniref:hypothetical protein n=1 Tax=Armatimonas sp. TaxID=1872638 RepID=UPI0037520EB7
MLQMQALSALTLAQRYAHLHRAPFRGKRLLTGSLLATSVLLLIVALPTLMGTLHPASTFLLTFVLLFWLPLLLTRSHTNRREEEEIYAQLLAVIKDDTLPLSLAERVLLLSVLPASTPPPLPALAQARLAQKLSYASSRDVAALPCAPLHAWLENPETPDYLKIALLLALGTAADQAIRPLAQAVASTAPTERLREAALECLKSLEQAR